VGYSEKVGEPFLSAFLRRDGGRKCLGARMCGSRGNEREIERQRGRERQRGEKEKETEKERERERERRRP
jgi:hypothetical protein